MVMKVGQISKLTGISVRTLHYYEEIELLSPSGRTVSGHRIYKHSDIVQLQQIRSLQQLGLSLQEISTTLKEKETSPLKTVKTHLKRTQDRIAQMHNLEKQLEKLVFALESSDKNVPVEQFLETLNLITVLDKYFDTKDAEKYRVKHQNISDSSWKTWIDEVKKEFDSGMSPTHKRARTLVLRWKKLINEMMGVSPEKVSSFIDLLQNEPDVAHQHGLDEEVLNFIKRTILEENK